MKKLIVPLIMLGVITVYALSNSFSLDTSELSFAKNSKKGNIVNDFNKDYLLNYSISEKNDLEKEEIKKIAKKTTYLLLGDFNNTNESSEHFYNRKMEFYSSRYNPKEKDNYSNVADFAIPQSFNQATEYKLIYNSFGEIRVEISSENALVSVPLPNAVIKISNDNDPMKYDYVKCDYMLYYLYRKQDNEWRLWYLYGEDSNEVEKYVNNVESMEETKQMAIAPSYESLLSDAYSFKELKTLKQSDINKIYNDNKDRIVYLNGIYNNYIVTYGNGFFVNDGIVVTTWDFLEKTLINAQYFTISSNGIPYKIEGIVTINPNSNIAVIKVEKNNVSPVKIGDYKSSKIEDPAIIISSKYGTGLVVQTGIIVSIDNYLQTSIPISIVDTGSPLFNQDGEVIGINTAKSVNTSISISVNADALREVQDKFKNINYDKIETISFDELKEKYYYVNYDDEIIYNNISDKKWEEYSKIGNVKETIKLKLIKASYQDGIVSLRYQNNISNIVKSMQLASNFIEKLIKDGYKEISHSTSKSVYENNKYKVIIMDEFDYLIIVMVRL